MKEKAISLGPRNRSSFTKVAFYLGYLSALVLFIIGLRHLGDVAEFDRRFGIRATLEGLFAFAGIYLVDLVKGKQFRIIPKRFTPITPKTLTRGILIFGVLALIQIVLMQIPLRIRSGEMAIAIVFAAPAEELFFRGVILSVIIELGKITKHTSHGPKLLRITPIELAGLVLSALAFMSIHINYYGNLQYMLIVFISGLILGFAYWYWEDLTACIVAHFILNVIVAYQTFWMVEL